VTLALDPCTSNDILANTTGTTLHLALLDYCNSLVHEPLSILHLVLLAVSNRDLPGCTTTGWTVYSLVPRPQISYRNKQTCFCSSRVPSDAYCHSNMHRSVPSSYVTTWSRKYLL